MSTHYLFYRIEKGILFLSLFLLLSGCGKEQSLNIPAEIQISQGTFLGVVHLSWAQVPDAQYYNIERMDPLVNDWVSAGSTVNTSFDDYGFNLSDNILVYGKHYIYRISAGSADAGDSEYTEANREGWAYDPQQVSVAATFESNGNVTVSWTESNPLDQLVNFTSAEYSVLRKNDAGPDYVMIGTITGETTYTDANPGDNPAYKVESKYHYTYDNMDYGTYDGITGMVSESTVASGGGPGTLTFTRTDLGTVSSSGGIPFMEIKEYTGTQYLGVIEDANAAEKGVPGLYMLNGTVWQKTAAPYPGDLMNETSLGHMDYAVDGNNIYLAGLSYDSLYLFAFDGLTWGKNMTMSNMGESDAPSSMATEVVDGTLYLAVTLAPDYDLKVLKWNGTGWVSVGGDANGWIETGKDIFDLEMQNIGGELFLSYTIKNSDYNSTFHIRHLNSNIWITDLDWTADNIIGLKLAGNGTSPLYFIARSQQQAVYPGGVFLVTSTTTVDDLITASDTWFLSPNSLTVDSNGNVYLASLKMVSAEVLYPVLYNYDGIKWSTLSGDFSDGTTPVAVKADGTAIYYVYGDASNLTTWYEPKSLKSARFTR